MKELKEEGVYASMQELDNPFEGKSNEDSLTHDLSLWIL